MSILVPKFLSLSLSTTLVLCTVLLLQKELNLFSHFQDSLVLGSVSSDQSVLSASVGFLEVGGGFSGC